MLYNLFTLIGIILGLIVSKRLNIKKPKEDIAYDLYIVAAIGIIIGAKIPIFILNGISLSSLINGKSVMGGMLGAFTTIHIYKYFIKKNEALCSAFAIPFAVALGVGKIGCYFNGCCGGNFFIPIQFIESLSQFIVAYLLYKFYKKTNNTELLFPLYILSYLIIRFFAEYIRISPTYALGLTIYQLLSIIYLPFVLYIIFKRTKTPCLN